MTNIIAYTYEADYHCPGCTVKRFAPKKGQKVDERGVPFMAHDADKNPVHPVFDIDELPTDLEDRHGGAASLNCGDCGAVIAVRDKNLETRCSE